MTEIERRILASLLGSVCFGYAAVSCLLFAHRIRTRALKYTQSSPGRHVLLPEKFVNSPRYIWSLWFAGAVGAIGFIVSSWQLVVNLLALIRGAA
jgi:hypothetical protein